MCGIIGIISKNPVQDKAILKIARDTMQHRGPDDAGEWWSEDGRVGLAHRRLSIIDLSPLGHQPMKSSEGDICIVFNGEIYNYRELKKELEQKGYRFSSNSDTEVILNSYKEWGRDCLSHLNGMFAFVLFDKKKKILLLEQEIEQVRNLYFIPLRIILCVLVQN